MGESKYSDGIAKMEAAAQAAEAEAKKQRRAIKKFYEEADKNQERLLERWGIEPNRQAQEVSDMFGCTVDEMWAWIKTERIVNDYRKQHPKGGASYGEEEAY